MGARKTLTVYRNYIIGAAKIKTSEVFITSEVFLWWRWRESNPRPKDSTLGNLRA